MVFRETVAPLSHFEQSRSQEVATGEDKAV